MKKVTILGSTGSVGKSALKVAEGLKEHIEIYALACCSNIDLLEEQAKKFSVERLAVYDIQKAEILQKRMPHARIYAGIEGMQEIARLDEVEFVLSAITGAVGILPTVAAIEKGKQIGLANKEVLVSAGEYVMRLAAERGSEIIPVDSEHSALFQSLKNEKASVVRRLILTASGGPFLRVEKEKLENITVTNALNHPNYRMGSKVTIDSSTLMNKGLEVIEAHFLFQIPINQIDVVIHPEQFIHSMVEYVDGCILSQASLPSMIFPIHYALTYPHRRPLLSEPPFDFTRNWQFSFTPPDVQKFPCLQLAYDSLREGGTMPCFMNAANEVLVHRFLEGKIRWLDIHQKLEKLLTQHHSERYPSLSKILEIDAQAREEAQCC